MKTVFVILLIVLMTPLVIAVDADNDGVDDGVDRCIDPTSNSVLFPLDSEGWTINHDVDILTYNDYVGCDCQNQLSGVFRYSQNPPLSGHPRDKSCVRFTCIIDETLKLINFTLIGLNVPEKTLSCRTNSYCDDGNLYYWYFIETGEGWCDDRYNEMNVGFCDLLEKKNSPYCVDDTVIITEPSEDEPGKIVEEDNAERDARIEELLFGSEELEDSSVILVAGLDPQSGDLVPFEEIDLSVFEPFIPYVSLDVLAKGLPLVLEHATINKFVDNSSNQTRVVVSVVPDEGFVLRDVSVYESIPKEFAFDVSELSFSVVPVVLDSDPLIMWHFDEVSDRVDLSYSVNRSINISGTTVVTAGEVMERKSYWNIIIPIAVVVLIVLIFLFKPSKRGGVQ